MWIRGHGHFVLCCDQAIIFWQTWSQSVKRNNRNATVEHKRQAKERSCHRRVGLRQTHRERERWRDGRESRDVILRFLSKRFDLSLHSTLRTNPIWHDRKHLSKKRPCSTQKEAYLVDMRSLQRSHGHLKNGQTPQWVITGLMGVMGPSVQFHIGDLQDVGESLLIAWRRRYKLS